MKGKPPWIAYCLVIIKKPNNECHRVNEPLTEEFRAHILVHIQFHASAHITLMKPAQLARTAKSFERSPATSL